MSLLLDALKRAEEAKRAKLAVDSAPTRELAEDVLPARGVDAAAAESASQELSMEDYKEVIPPRAKARSSSPASSAMDGTRSPLALESIADAGLIESPISRTPLRDAGTPASATPPREVARHVFVAKQQAGPEGNSRKKWLLPVAAVILVMLGGGGWYVWNEINRISRPPIPSIAARPVATGVLVPAPAKTSQADAKQQDTSAPAPQRAPALPPLLPPSSAEAPLPAPEQRTAGAALSEREALARSLKDAPAAKEAPLTLHLARSIEPSRVNAELAGAYAALKKADYSRAKALYASLVRSEPLNLDAQLGMATVFARQGDLASAVKHYREVLALDPRNGTALAGLLSLGDAASPSLEVELRTLVGRNPDASSLRFTLGNLYASERRWVEAQQAYFEAYRLESENADYAYNLAVSLDHLKQTRLAMDYYGKALALSAKTGGQFDAAAVSGRIRDLSVDGKEN